MDRNKVVLVDSEDELIGMMDKLEAHQLSKLHTAFSIFILNHKGEMLIQQRAFHKYHGGGLWTNTCCSHPQMHEDVHDSAKERLYYEMGLDEELKFLYKFLYHSPVENNLIEHEIDHVFIGYSHSQPTINPDEVHDYRWINTDELLSDIHLNPELYTVWFKTSLPQVLSLIEHQGKCRI